MPKILGGISTDGYVDAALGFRHGSATTPSWLAGPGTPEGAVSAPVGSMFSRSDGGTDTALYRKETGTGNTGWVATAAAAAAGVTSVDGRTGIVTLADKYVDITGDTMTGLLTAPNLAVGATAPATGALRLTSGTTAVEGIQFGADTNLYRTGAGLLRTDGGLVFGTAPAQSGTIRMSLGQSISMRDSLGSSDFAMLGADASANVYLRGFTTLGIQFKIQNADICSIGSLGLTMTNGSNIIPGTSTGTKIGTGTTQKFAFWNATPIVQPANTSDIRQALLNLGLIATGGANPLDTNGGAVTASTLSSTGVTGANLVSRYTGATTSGAPTSGTFVVGDWIVDRAGALWLCTVAGTPGTWVNGAAGAAPVTSVDGRTGVVTLADKYVDVTGDTMTGTLGVAPVLTSWGANRFGVDSQNTVNVASAESAFAVMGVQARSVKQGAGDLTTSGGVRGLNAIADVDGTGNVTEAIGVLATVRNLNATSTVTSAIGMRVESPGDSANLITNATGVTIKNQGRTGTAAAVGLNVHAQTGAATVNIGAQIGAASQFTLLVSSDANSTTSAGGITFGSSKDTNLYRSAVAQLKTTAELVVAPVITDVGTTSHRGLYVQNQTSNTIDEPGAVSHYGLEISMNKSGAGNAPASAFVGAWAGVGVVGGTASQVTSIIAMRTHSGAVVNSYGINVASQGTSVATTSTGVFIQGAGSGAGTAYGLRVLPQIGSTAGFGVAIAGSLTSTLWVSSDVDGTTSPYGMTFGASRDTNLYRSAADTLKTDDNLHVVGSVGVGTTPTSAVKIAASVSASYPSGGGPLAMSGTMAYTSPTSSTAFVAGASFVANVNVPVGTTYNNTAPESVVALIGDATVTAEGTFTSPVAGVIGIIRKYGEQPVTITRSFFAYGPIVGAGTITSAIGLDIAAQKSAGVTNGYGIYQRGAGDYNVFNGVTQLIGQVQMGDGAHFAIGTATGTKFGLAANNKIGFWNATPVVQNTGWSATAGYTALKAFNPATTTLNEVARVLGTLLDTLKSYGVLG